MDYSNESFERFQQTLKQSVGEDSLLWDLRDALFAEAFYGKRRKFQKLYSIPGGWLLVLMLLWLQGRRQAAKISVSTPATATHQFLFLSARNNHTARLLPLFRQTREHHPCIAWHTQPELGKLANDDELPDFRCAAAAWIRHTQWTDLPEARRSSLKLRSLFPTEINHAAYSAITIYLVQFFAWRRFWKSMLGPNCQYIVSTFEKATYVKAFFYTARDLEMPTRIHWIHGLRHASIQATLATELWCMTPGDVRFFKPRVPGFCTPRVEANPEEAQLAEIVGLLDPSAIAADQPIQFLFLGPGKEKSYTRAMRMDDLQVIYTLQEQFDNRISWRFRPHPSNKEPFRQELLEAGITIDDFSTRHLHDDLKWSHAIGSSWSSLLLDVRATGRPIFWVQKTLHGLGATDELIADGIGVHLDATNGPDRLARTFSRWEADG